MKKAELIALRGGSSGWWYCWQYGWIPYCTEYQGPVYWPWSDDSSEVRAACSAMYGVTCGCVAPAY
mgnify:FL=1